MNIDSHQHFWVYNKNEYDWIPEESIRRDFLPTDLEPILASNNFDGTIAVQARQSEEETNWLLQLAAENDIIKGVVGWIDLQEENVKDRITYYKQSPLLKGFRHIVQAEPDDRFMLRPNFLRGINELYKAGIPYDILIFPKQLPAALELVKKFPEHDFVIDHIAKPNIKDAEIDFWKSGIHSFKAFENVRCKLSGMVTETNFSKWRPSDFTPYLDHIIDTFGPKRLMIGSDWPVCKLSGEYGPVMNIVKDYITKLSSSEQEQILGETASNFYKL